METYVLFNQAERISESLNMVKESGLNGLILAVLVLFVFLLSFRSTAIVSIAIPLSVVSAFIPLYFLGTTLNILTMAGLAIGIGMVVDNAIVVLEDIFRHLQVGLSPKEAALKSGQEIAMPVIASTATTLAVFLPIAFVEGIAGQIFKDLAYAVSFSMGFSLLISFTVIPMLAVQAFKLELKRKTSSTPTFLRP